MRRFASLLALMGCLLHATLLPWHAAARMPAQLDAERLAQDLLVICHGAGGTTTSEAPADPGSGDQSQCPICKGIVGFQLVVLAAAELGLLERTAVRVALDATRDDPTSSCAIQPRSRGPPLTV